MSPKIAFVLLIIFLCFLIFINYKFNNVIIRLYNNLQKMPKILISCLSVIAIVCPALLSNNWVLERFQDFLPDNISNKIKKQEKNIREPVKFKTKKERKVTDQMKKYVAAKQEWKCKKCNKILGASFETDHIVPLYKGGDNSEQNLQALCRNCHGDKTIYDKIKEIL